jgi:hypothetical protein
MPLSSQPAHYIDCRTYMDQALDAEKGIKITAETPGKAINLRQRFYKAISLDRKANFELYPAGDPNHGRSAYDKLSIAVDGNFVILRKMDAVDLEVEEL